MTTPTPADMPHAILTAAERLRRQETAQNAVDALRGARPIETTDADPTAAADDQDPAPVRAPIGLNRYQDIRDRALGHAIRFYEQDDQADIDDHELIATADRFADWIRRGYHL